MTRVNSGKAAVPETPGISEAESAVMEVLWRNGPQTADAVCRQLQGGREWQESTVKTLLNRLLKKGAVSAEAEGRRYIYTPQLQRDAWLQQTSQSLLDRLFGGRVAPLVAHFSSQRKLSRRDVEELRQLLQDLDR